MFFGFRRPPHGGFGAGGSRAIIRAIQLLGQLPFLQHQDRQRIPKEIGHQAP
jgi:hypothetical protein